MKRFKKKKRKKKGIPGMNLFIVELLANAKCFIFFYIKPYIKSNNI